uniref:Uncharacterized protein n=1 Tax=mine drainage metagenome TaxID=410659 RepID=E6QI15_9ZZZZ
MLAGSKRTELVALKVSQAKLDRLIVGHWENPEDAGKTKARRIEAG